ncbi:MAG TPA: transposase [Rhizobium sp.]|nr:transposase [Rhizobium sp.]
MEDDDQRLRVRLVGGNGRRRYDPASKDRLVAACLEPGVSVSKLALEHGVNANLLRKWIKKRTETQSRAAPFSSPAKVSASLPNGVKLTLECGDVDALTAIIGALGHVQTGR